MELNGINGNKESITEANIESVNNGGSAGNDWFGNLASRSS
jgi:hypothetical protein